ncbi:MAG TPA: hypothetical protein VJV04_03955 [Nitrospiraceae bacterium]|nr:hypothetical protein [Nitrospiraceae bacterium]
MASDDRTPGPRVDAFSRWIDAIPHYAVLLLVWPIVWGGSAVSIWLAYRTGQFVWRYLFILTHDNFQELLSGLLHCIELLLLIPLPGIAGAVAFRNLRTYLNPAASDRSPVERERAMAKRLILGTLVAVAGTRLLIEFLERNTDLSLYLSGTLLIGAMTLYAVLALHPKE